MMSRRFKRVKAHGSREVEGHAAIRLELITQPRVTALSLEERKEETELDRRRRRYRAGRQGCGQGDREAGSSPPGRYPAAPKSTPPAVPKKVIILKALPQSRRQPAAAAPAPPQRLPARQNPSARVRGRSPTPTCELASPSQEISETTSESAEPTHVNMEEGAQPEGTELTRNQRQRLRAKERRLTHQAEMKRKNDQRDEAKKAGNRRQGL